MRKIKTDCADAQLIRVFVGRLRHKARFLTLRLILFVLRKLTVVVGGCVVAAVADLRVDLVGALNVVIGV